MLGAIIAVSNLERIVSGGQTGVDQGALSAAAASGVSIGGWCPPGRAAENGRIPDWFPLKETPKDRSSDAPTIPRSQRTEWNVRDSDATLILWPASLQLKDLGTRFTAECASRYKRPLLICDPYSLDLVSTVRIWINEENIKVLNVAGPSEQSSPGVGRSAEAFIAAVLRTDKPTLTAKTDKAPLPTSENNDPGSDSGIGMKTEKAPWWVAMLGRASRILGASGLMYAFASIVLVLALAAFIAVKFLNFRVIEGHVYLGGPSELGAHATVDAIAAFQTSGIRLRKGQAIRLTPDGRVIVAIDHQVHLAQAVKGYIVQRSPANRWPLVIQQRYPEVPLTEQNVFYRDWTGPEGQEVQSDLLDECKLRKDLGWGALMFVVLPDEPSARTDPYDVLTSAHLSPDDLIPLPYAMTYTTTRDGWLAFVINEAVMSPKSPSEDSRSFYSILKRTSEELSADPRHQIPLGSIPLLWYADNAGAFRVVVQQE